MIKQVKSNIKEQLKQSNMTIQELCKLMRKDRRYIYRITDEVKLNKIIEIAKYIGCNPSELLKGLQSAQIILSIPFFRNNKSRGVERKHFRFHIENAISGHCRFVGSIVQKSSLKLKIVLAKSKGAGIFFSTFAPKIFHARIIISSLQLHH